MLTVPVAGAAMRVRDDEKGTQDGTAVLGKLKRLWCGLPARQTGRRGVSQPLLGDTKVGDAAGNTDLGWVVTCTHDGGSPFRPSYRDATTRLARGGLCLASKPAVSNQVCQSDSQATTELRQGSLE
jgi:hypothetical protein